MLTTKLATATDEQLPKLIRLLGTPASGKVEEQRSTMMEWMEKRRVDDGKAIINNHPYEQVKPPLHVVQKEQCFGRYFSAREPYCAEKCAFAAECLHTLQASVAQIIKGGSSLTESKEGLTKDERKKIMAKDIKNAKKAAAPVAPKKTRNPEPEEIDEEEPTLEEEEEEDEVEEVEEEADEVEEVEETEDEDEEEEAEESDEEDEDDEDSDEDDEEEEDADEEDEEEEKPAPKKAPAKAAPVKEAPKAKEAPKKAAPAPSSVTGQLTKKVVPFEPFGAGVVVKLNSDENSLKGSDTAHDLVNELLAVAEDSRLSQLQFLECIQKVFVISDDKSEQSEVCKGIAEELKEKGVLKLVRAKTA